MSLDIRCPKCGYKLPVLAYDSLTNRLNCHCGYCDARWNELPLDARTTPWEDFTDHIALNWLIFTADIEDWIERLREKWGNR